MKIKRDNIINIARLARLELSDKELDLFAPQLALILDYIAQLKEVDTSGVEPTSHVLSIQNVFREDLIKPSLGKDDALKNAPSKEDGLFKVPRIIEES